MRTAILAAAAALLCIVATAAQAETALAFRSRCTGMTGKANIGMCRATVGAAISDLKDKPAYCVPKDLNGIAALPVVQTYLSAHPDVTNLSADDVIAKAMADAYPCPAKP
jgi:Rap1a immunity proteins